MPRLAAVVMVLLLLLADPSLAQSDLGSRARELCLSEADRQGIRVLSLGGARERRDYQDRLQDVTVMMDVLHLGRSLTARCLVRAPSGRAVIDLADRDGNRRPAAFIPSLYSTQDRCERAADRQGFRVERLVRQDDLVSRGRITGRETTLAVRRDGRRGGLICIFDFVSDRMTLEFVRR